MAWYLPSPAYVQVGAGAALLRADEQLIVADVLELMVIALVTNGQVRMPVIAVRADGRQITIDMSGAVSPDDDTDAGAIRASLAQLAALLPAAVEDEIGADRWLVRYVLRRWAA